MKLKFDANQQFQLDAINAMVGIFDGQPLNKGDFEISFQSPMGPGLFSSQVQTELGSGNQLVLDEAQVLKNIRAIQLANDMGAALMSPRDC